MEKYTSYKESDLIEPASYMLSYISYKTKINNVHKKYAMKRRAKVSSYSCTVSFVRTDISPDQRSHTAMGAEIMGRECQYQTSEGSYQAEDVDRSKQGGRRRGLGPSCLGNRGPDDWHY